MITFELTEDEVLSLHNLLDVAVCHEGMRAAIFAVTLDAKNRVKAIQKTLERLHLKIKQIQGQNRLRLCILKPFDMCMDHTVCYVLKHQAEDA